MLPLCGMQPLIELTLYHQVFPDRLSHAIFELRLLWMRAQLLLGRGDPDIVSFFYLVLDCFMEHPELEGRVVRRTNCRRGTVISLEVVQASVDAHTRYLYQLLYCGQCTLPLM